MSSRLSLLGAAGIIKNLDVGIDGLRLAYIRLALKTQHSSFTPVRAPLIVPKMTNSD